MKLKVLKNEEGLYDKELQVKNINYDMIVANLDDKKICLNIDEVKLIAENPYEDTIIKYKDVLKIKLGKKTCITLYTAIVNTIKDVLGTDIYSIAVLKDEDREMKKNMWEKNLSIVVNNSFPLYMNIVGSNFGKRFDMLVKKLTLEEFIDNCKGEIAVLEKELMDKQNTLNSYNKSLNRVINNSITNTKSDVKKLKA